MKSTFLLFAVAMTIALRVIVLAGQITRVCVILDGPVLTVQLTVVVTIIVRVPMESMNVTSVVVGQQENTVNCVSQAVMATQLHQKVIVLSVVQAGFQILPVQNYSCCNRWKNVL